MEIIRCESREDWLKQRGDIKRIGGSEAGAVIGLNPWMTNLDLWRIKTGRAEKPKVGNPELVEYGRKAEEHIRELFKLDFPEFKVWHEENAMILNEKFPWALASVDGIITDPEGHRTGILEIKTAAMVSALARKKWDGRIPDSYYAQILQYMAVVDADFAVLVAQLTYGHGEDLVKTVRHYWIDRADAQEDIDALMAAERDFWDHVENDTEPALILPRI